MIRFLEQGSSKDMKLYQLVMAAVLSSTVLYGSVAAEYQDDKLFGNGKFLRRLRSDVAKKLQPKPNDGKKANVDPRAKVPTPARKRTVGNAPTRAERPGNAPTPATRSGNASKSVTRPSVVARPASTRPKSSSLRGSGPNVASGSGSEERPSKANLSNKNSASGFGMQFELKSDRFTVTKVDSRGNAYEAGLKKGDVILGAGGVELGSIEEFDEISKILGQGDQLEFKISRRGKKQDLLIQYGKAPAEVVVTKSSQPGIKIAFRSGPQRDDKLQTGNQSDALRMIERQRQQIEQLQQEIERLKRQTPVLVAPGKSKPSTGNTFSKGPSLSGPGK